MNPGVSEHSTTLLPRQERCQLVKKGSKVLKGLLLIEKDENWHKTKYQVLPTVHCEKD